MSTEFSEPIHVKYRPKRLKDVIGQGAVVKSLEAALKAAARPHTFFFTGPAGTGKTTLARIVAADSGCEPGNLVEIDAASNSGVDDMRAVTQALAYKGFGSNPAKAVIVDECHRLSKNAWDALLKATEEPPSHVYFFFCSTEPDKIPKAIMTRALAYGLQSVRYDDLMDLLEEICDKEGYKTSTKILQAVADASQGSARGALTMLAKVHACEDVEEAEALLQVVGEDNAEVIELARLLCFGRPTWGDVTKCLTSLGEVPPESVRIIITNYVGAVLMKPKNSKDVPRLLDILQAFSKPCNPSDKWAPIMLAVGRLIYD